MIMFRQQKTPLFWEKLLLKLKKSTRTAGVRSDTNLRHQRKMCCVPVHHPNFHTLSFCTECWHEMKIVDCLPLSNGNIILNEAGLFSPPVSFVREIKKRGHLASLSGAQVSGNLCDRTKVLRIKQIQFEADLI